MDDLGAQVVPPVFIHQTFPTHYTGLPSTSNKRPLSYHNHLHHHSHTWNPKTWDWDTDTFLIKPSDPALLHSDALSSKPHFLPATPLPSTSNNNTLHLQDDQTLRLNLGPAPNFNCVEQPLSKPPKKLRPDPGSPATATYPMCQVDNCKEDLSNAKDYHRRHKVCQLHSKSTKALVANLMQRFCQQCSRFHPLSEFDDGKRSCRRRLAGHNWRRRKTQPEDVTSRLTPPGSRGPPSGGNLDIFSLLAVLARTQGQAIA